MTRRWPIAGVVFGGLWVLVRGVDAHTAAIAGEFLLGITVGLPIAFVFRRLYAEGIHLRGGLRSIPYVALFLLSFVREVTVANIDVAYRVLAPSMPIDPEVIIIPLRVETDLGVTTIANSITITPGTLTLDHDPDKNALYVHVIDGRDLAAILEPIRTWEDYALIILDEDRSPADPAPDITVQPPGPDGTLPPTQRSDHRDGPHRGGDGGGH